MRILMLTQWFDPEPTLKGMAFAQALARRGHQVHVITGFPNYPGGVIYPGYRVRVLQRERHGDVYLWRVPLFPSHDAGKLGRIANYLSFMIALVIAGVFLVPKPAAIYAYHPPLTVGLAARVIAFFRRAPVLYDVQDLWPETLRATGMITNERLLAVIGSLANWVYRRMDYISVLSPGFREVLLARGVAPSRLIVIPNWAPTPGTAHAPCPTLNESIDRPFCLLFAGNMGKAQSLRTILEAAAIVARETQDIEFVLIGGGIERASLEQHARDLSLKSVKFLEAVPASEIDGVLASTDVLIVHLADDPLFAITIPSKTQAYLAAGRPILMAVRGDAADLVEAAGAGLLASPGDAQSIASAALLLASMSQADRAEMGRRGRAYYDRHLAFEIGANRFAERIEMLGQSNCAS